MVILSHSLEIPRNGENDKKTEAEEKESVEDVKAEPLSSDLPKLSVKKRQIYDGDSYSSNSSSESTESDDSHFHENSPDEGNSNNDNNNKSEYDTDSESVVNE
ncbi:hypothetical protein Phum_PHUM427210 [Pediculus humanus corporis]|uniref:Uncharacterized protein n=1 Tax=Pediculus humanus subsp. corporis TaxID=121224 RepID=E0VT60_PEDHC|nr:uncharacterized protein Phum_PHUM427210 [Pediculus humanus corporis]EEB16566.1 hypothetical protein Phum_PHUM427210 [Pediculus humanus corporis]